MSKWIRCTVEREQPFSVPMRDGTVITFRRYPDVGVQLASVPNETHRQVLLGVPEAYVAWEGPEPEGAEDLIQAAILRSSVAPQQPTAPTPVPAPASSVMGHNLEAMSDEALRAYSESIGLKLHPKMLRDNMLRRIREMLELKHEQDLEALNGGEDTQSAPEGSGAGA